MGKYSVEVVKQVWYNCFSTTLDQVDAFGRTIKFDEYGQDSECGWEIDLIWPLEPKGNLREGSNTFSNAQPLHHKSIEWKGNKIKQRDSKEGKAFEVEKMYEYDGKIIGRLYVEGYSGYNYSKWQ